MKERPILFSGEMVKAILAGTKTMTRRIVKCGTGGQVPTDKAIVVDAYPNGTPGWFAEWPHAHGHRRALTCPFGVPGDRLWVRETWHPDVGPTIYAADYGSKEQAGVARWHPAIHMFRADSRLDLEITAVCVERLQDITGDDAKAEGVEPDFGNAHTVAARDYQRSFERLWDSINGKRASWESNPWTWVVSFRRVRP